MEKRTGKTVRFALRALADASEGYRVILVCPTIASADRAFTLIRHFVGVIPEAQIKLGTSRIMDLQATPQRGLLQVITQEIYKDMQYRRCFDGEGKLKVVFDE